MQFEKEKILTVLAIMAVLAGILVVPPVVQHFYGFSAVKTAFIVIIIYAVINWGLKKRNSNSI